MSNTKSATTSCVIGWLVAIYLLVLTAASVSTVVDIFPETESLAVQVVGKVTDGNGDGTPPAPQAGGWERLDRLRFGRGRFLFIDLGTLSASAGLVALALLAGVIGASLHGMNSLAAYHGNKQFKLSWVLFYVLRPAIGAAIGFLFYFVVRAGFLTGPDGTTSPYGVIAFSGLAGLFADTALEMLAKVFKSIFNVADGRSDKLQPPATPVVSDVTPNPVPAGGDVELAVTGKSFDEKCVVKLGDKEIAPTFVDATQLKVPLKAADRPKAGEVDLVVVNPEDKRSDAYKVKFA